MIKSNDFQMNHITEIRFGSGISDSIGNEVKKYGSKVLVISDVGLRGLGIVETITGSLERAKLDHILYDDVLPNPRDSACHEAANKGRDSDVDVVVAVGGGSAMDTAKAVSVLMSNGGTCTKWAEIRKFEKSLVPVICVPTTSGTGSEVTFEAVINSTELGRKVSISDGNKMAPKLAIMDPKLTLSVPPLVTASTGMDALTHAIEAYTCLYSQPISDGLALYAMKKISASIIEATQDGNNLKAREDMMVGSLMAGMAFTNSFLGAVHAFSERLGGFYDIPHGIANAIFLPFVTEYNVSANYGKHAVVAECLGVETYGLNDIEASKAGVRKLFELNRILGIPKFKDLEKVSSEDFDELSELCMTHPCGAKANPRKIETEDYKRILKKAYAY